MTAKKQPSFFKVFQMLWESWNVRSPFCRVQQFHRRTDTTVLDFWY